MARRRSNQQPTRVPTGGPRGQRQQLEAAQNAIPLPRSGAGASATAPTPAGQPAAGGGSAGPAMMARPDVFAPTGRPGEPVTAGAPVGPGPQGRILPDDPVQFLRAIAMAHPTPGIMRLLERAARR